MGKFRAYVGNIPFKTTEDELRTLFAPRAITEVKIVLDRDTGRPRGFGFVEFKNGPDMESAIAELNGAKLDGRVIVVNQAKEREKRSGGERNGRAPSAGRGREDYDRGWK